jgi:hypothetical protein
VSKLSCILLLLAVSTGCGGSSAWAQQARELIVQSDYGQIYVYDPGLSAEASLTTEDTEDDNQLTRSLDDAYDTRRFVGYDNGLVNILTPSQYNPKARLRLEIGSGEPPLETAEWEHVVEVPLPAPSGAIVFEASGGGRPIETTIPPDVYRARISCRGYRIGAGEIEGAEEYLVQLWPTPEAAPKLVKYWPGWDTMRPAGPQG